VPQRLVILPPYDWPDVAAARDAIAKWYFPLNAEIAFGVEGFAPAEITLATGWQTAYWVAHHRASAEKFYFVQDFEPWFHSISSEYFLAENTYKLGLKAITAGSWLSETLSRDYGMRCGAVSFSCEHDFYYPRERREQPNLNILFYSRHVSRRRLFELGMAALAQVCAEEPRAAVIFAGGDVGGFEFPYKHLNAGELSLAELPDLYSQCDLALVLSGTNLSLLPLELAACKCPLVMNDSPSARWLLPDEAAYYAPLDPRGMAETILAAIRDEDGRRARAEAAHAIAAASSWEAQADRMLAILQELKG
jgi:glycosyltransferase involved in cell wall biosynthesis